MSTSYTPDFAASDFPAKSPSSRRFKPSGGSAFDYSSLFQSSETGFVLHGTQSGFYTDSALTTEASVSASDPIGGIDDLSGTGNNLIQTASANKPVFYESGGVKSYRTGAISSVERLLYPAVDTFVSAAVTCIHVSKKIQQVGSVLAYNLSTYRANNWDAGGFYGFGYELPASSDGSFADTDKNASNRIVSTLSSGLNNPLINVYARSGIGANEASLTTYNLSASQIDQIQAQQNSLPTNGMVLGLDRSGTGVGSVIDTAFMLHIDRELTSQEIADVLSDLSSSFGGWE